MDSLEVKLGQWASGSNGTEAAVELLIETDYWLTRSEFTSRAVSIDPMSASIDWEIACDLANELQCSRGERFILLLACSLADEKRTVAMSDIATLDGKNLKRVTEVLHTAKFGWQ